MRVRVGRAVPRSIAASCFLASVAAVFGGAACGDGDDESPPGAQACGQITDAACAKLVECKASSGGTAFTSARCAAARPQVIDSCVSDQGPALAAASDADVAACVDGFRQMPCSELCNRVPIDPAPCQKFSPKPNTNFISCAP